MNLLLNGLRSRLLRPVLLSLVIIGVVQVAITLMITQSSVSSLVEDVVQTLKQGNDQLASGLQQSGTSVGQTMEQLANNVGTALGQTLSEQLATEQRNVSKELVDSIHQSAQGVAEIMALVSPDAIWDRDTPTLTRFVSDLQRNPQVVFSAYFDMEGKPLTRYLDRSNAKVKELLSKGEGQRSLDKVIDAARKDGEIYLIEVNINPKGAVIGQFVLAISEHDAHMASQALEQRFADLIASSREQVQQSIDTEAKLAQQGLQQSLTQASELNRQTGEEARNVIGSAATKLVSKISLALIILGVVLVVALMVILAIRVVAKVRNLTLALDDLAEGEGDLTQRIAIDSQDEIADMAEAVNLFIEKTQRLVQQANSAADQTAERVADTHRLTDQANQAVDRQHQQLGQASSAMAEMVSSIHQVAERIQQNLANVDTIRHASASASQISSQVRSDIETLVEQVRQASEVVNGVANQSQQIEVVLEVIKSIAEQTNLLALNAAIEAARAGESGRGFAVVADEVRALAGKTQQSTEDIQQRIDALQHEVGQAVSVIERVCGSAEVGIEHIGHSDQQMQQVSASVEKLYDLTNDIAAMAEEQSQVSADINNSVGQISDDAELAASSMQQNIEATNALDGLASSLKQTLKQFKV